MKRTGKVVELIREKKQRKRQSTFYSDLSQSRSRQC
jgi:hypothetical protein